MRLPKKILIICALGGTRTHNGTPFERVNCTDLYYPQGHIGFSMLSITWNYENSNSLPTVDPREHDSLTPCLQGRCSSQLSYEPV